MVETTERMTDIYDRKKEIKKNTHAYKHIDLSANL